MQALKAGDERFLPPRDRGPVRSYVRDAVDSRRSVGEFFLPLAMVIFVLTWLGNAQLKVLGSMMWMFLIVLMVVDSVALAVRLRRGVARNFPEDSRRGATAYGLLRSMQIRKFRLPPPKVSPRWGRPRAGRPASRSRSS